MNFESLKGVFLLTALSAGVVLFTGCRTSKEKMLDTAHASNTFLDPGVLSSDAELSEDKEGVLMTWNATANQSQHLLQLGEGGTLKARHHRRHDLTLTCVSGSGIVEIEDTRYRLEPGRSVVIPRFHSYNVLVDEGSSTFQSILVYSPPFKGEDVEITEN